MSVSTKIEFEGDTNVFYSGQLIKGLATVTLTEEKVVRGVYVRILGRGYCEWPQNQVNNTYNGTEVYVDEKIYYIGDESNTDDIRITPGTYTYPFSHKLSAEVPSTLEGEVGFIRYTIKVVFDRPSWQIPSEERRFIVIKPLNLNADFNLLEPVTIENKKTFNVCCWVCCWQSNPMTIVARLPMSGFIPGQTIPLEFDILNDSTENISTLLVHLNKEINYFSNDNTGETKKEISIIAEEQIDSVQRFNSNTSEKMIFKSNIIVPVTPPSDTTTSNIIKVNYSLELIVVVGLCHEDPIITIPIKIGTIPIENSLQQGSVDPVGIIAAQPTATAPLLENDENDENVVTPHTYIGKTKFNSRTPKVVYSEHQPPTYEEATTSNE